MPDPVRNKDTDIYLGRAEAARAEAEEATLDKLKVIASEFDVTDQSDEIEVTSDGAEEEPATSRR